MKLGEAIRNKDYGLFKPVSPSFYNYYDQLSYVLYADGYRIDSDHHDAVTESGRVKCYAVREWWCTDTNVGLYLYLIDDEPVCLMYQNGRKSYPQWSFLSSDAHKKTVDLFDACKPIIKPNFPTVCEDILELRLDQSTFGQDISTEQVGLSPMRTYERYIRTLTKHSLSDNVVAFLTGVTQRHRAVFDQLQQEGDQAAIERFVKRSPDGLYEHAMELLK